ncbi:peptidoglycan bridge formation protein FemAB [Photobacterium gaetbulicola]|uniref:Peptidoglycan bridge formation protein FemAB n=1 Tax=Photobacterium gaetbulicola TaxID=1295392 RepID=A0A0B9G693_9GAMM|nr:FemAB family XrtA/PEP-CTERM system-associated protein [Photobacterium gaetbulicola]KHT64193.1 peptidoglycan bridge formation protein FemAB [Photobacterium gaetbulicola]
MKAMQNLTVRKLTPNEHQLWDKYVDHHPEGSFFHLSGWLDVINSVFGHKHHYLLAEQDTKLVGVLPLFEQKSWLFGHALISTPFCVYGGALSDSASVREKLEAAAYELGCQLNVDYVELRDKNPIETKGPWVTHCHHASFECSIPADPDAILTGVKRKQRAVIRHSQKNQLQWDNSDKPQECFNLYAESVRNLGTPVFSGKLFTALKDKFGDRCETLIIQDKDQQPVSGVLSFYYKDQVLPYYGGGKYESRELKSNDFMYFQLMHLAHEKGITHFDFGRSKLDSGSYIYKKHWGMTEVPLHYRVALVKAKSLPNLSPNNPKYKYFIKLWQKLPLGLSQKVGPFLSKYLG